MTKVPDFLLGGGEMGALMRAHDWSGSSLGPPTGWPQSLRTVVRLMLNTGHPMYIWWGPELACLYNDAYRESIGPERHPVSLGRAAREIWDEIWPIIGPQIDQVMSGRGATWHVDQLVPITRFGRLDDVYWTYSYSPIDDETAANGIGGVLVVCSETTKQVLAARRLTKERDRLAQLFEQAPIFMAVLEGPAHTIRIANPAYLQLVGHREVLGKAVAEALPEVAAQGYVALLDNVYASGDAYAASGAKVEVQPIPGGAVTECFLDFVYQPIRNADDKVTGIFIVGADVTERMRAFAAMRESEARFRAALKAGRMGYWETDFTTATRIWSREAMALFGLDLVDGKGRVGGPEDEYVAALHPDDRHLVERFRELAEQQDSFAADYRVVRSDGATLWLSGRGSVTARGPGGQPQRLISVMADVTETRQAEAMLRVERERLRLALSAGQMGAYELDIDSDTLWWSPETYDLFGVDRTTFTPTRESVIDLLHPEDRPGFAKRRREAIIHHKPFFDEFRIRRPDGSQIWIGYRGQAEYDAQGRAVRTFGVVMDVTERKKAEQVLRDADREKDDFIATLSHELRNPLAPIRNAVNALRQLQPGDPRVAWCHDVIGRQTDQMSHLLDDLLDVSRLTRRQLTLRKSRLDLVTVVEQAIEIAQPLIDAAGHELRVELPPETLALEGDLTRLAQVFSNVLINSAKYTPANGRISVTASRDADAVVVKVKDTGIGIAQEDIAQIFEMFGQVESARTRSQGGQGIGLSLARGLVDLHGGSIQARSEGVGKGSEFEIRLPLVAP
ncbi:MAG TPA: ATP-binding protein [Caldimonas sp.]|jgi:PAS domain S-box-containing protein|nr:ATP-binding protein [Caldimonas sp.]HEX4233775.1 ATP-binding protein [Caldimonas sp.]